MQINPAVFLAIKHQYRDFVEWYAEELANLPDDVDWYLRDITDGLYHDIGAALAIKMAERAEQCTE